MKKRILIIALIVSLSGTLISKEISNIKLVYGLEGTHLMVSASCTPESFDSNFCEDINFLTTYDEIFIEQFNDLYEKLLYRKDSIKNIDPRIMTIIYYKDSISNDTIYFGEHYGISRNGILLQDNEDLLNLIKQKIGWVNRYNKK